MRQAAPAVAAWVALSALLCGTRAQQSPLFPATNPAFAGPAQPVWPYRDPLYFDRKSQAKIASCVVDVFISTQWLGKAGTQIDAAIKVCKTSTFDSKGYCSSAINGVISAFGFAASFLSAAATDCAMSLQLRAACAADISGFISALTLVGNAASGISQVCKAKYVFEDIAEFKGYDNVKGDFTARVISIDSDRRLQEVEEPSNETERLLDELAALTEPLNATQRHLTDALKPWGAISDANVRRLNEKVNWEVSDIFHRIQVRRNDLAECAFDVAQATFFMARAGLAINAAVLDCSNYKLHSAVNSEKQAACAVDVSTVIQSFTFVASGISFAVFHCPLWKRSKAACAGEIINLVSAIATLSATAAGFEATCGRANIPGQDPELTPTMQGARRLAPMNDSATEAITLV